MSEPRLHTLETVLGNVALEGCTVQEPDHYWERDTRKLVYHDQSVSLDVEDLAAGLAISVFDGGQLTCVQACDLVHVLRVATAVAEAYDERTAKLREEAAEAERARVQRAAEERAAREAEQEARKERLLNEFVGEKGRIRLAGMKRYRPVIVDSVERGDNSWEPVFNYVYDRHGYREYMNGQVRVFEIKVGSRYQTVWNDGQDDLNQWDRNAKAPAPLYRG